MDIDIRARHTDLADSIKEYILERGQRIGRYFEGVSRCEFVLDRDAKTHVVDVKVHAPRSDLTATSSHEDLQAAIDLAMDKIERQVRKLKSRFKKHPRGERAPHPEPGELDLATESGEETYEDVVKEEL